MLWLNNGAHVTGQIVLHIIKVLRSTENAAFLFLKLLYHAMTPSGKDLLKNLWSGRLVGAILRSRNYVSGWLYEISKPKGIVLLSNVRGNKMYVDTEDRTTAPHLLLDRVWEKYKTELFEKIIIQGMTVVDVGASIGYYTLIAAQLVGKTGLVYAFEPEPCNYELLCKNIEVNGFTNVVPQKKAVSNKNGKAKLYYERERIVNPSLSKNNVLAVSGRKTLEKGGFVEVETISLDEFLQKVARINRIDVIKIDTEGAEGLVLDGSEKTLRNNNLAMFLEFWPDGLRNLGTDPLKLLEKLQEYGFKAKLINEANRSVDPIEIIEFCRGMTPGQGVDLLLER